MKTLLLLAAVLAGVSATGYYYQESSSRSSSSSFKNNELQHQSEDESYYSKHGDTEGRAKPKVNTYSQHLEYKNPHSQDQSSNYGQSVDLDAYAARQAVGSDGIVRTVTGNRDQYTYQATYGVSGGDVQPLQAGQYDTQSNLLSLTQRLQNDLSRQLQSAITAHKSYSSYGTSGSTYVESQFRNLEQELKANLTRQLQEELQRQYGTQVSRGSHSYTVNDGRYATQANYNTQELDDLTQQIQRNLLQQLRSQYQSSSSSSDSSYYASQQHTNQGSRAHTTMYRPTTFPVRPEVRPSVPLNQVVAQVQATVDTKLNEALDTVDRQYVSGDVVYTDAPNFDLILENLKQELIRNITTILQATLVEHYGAQEEHNNYYYSSRNVAAGSQVANYNVNDLDALRQQIENNLLEKLRNTIQQQRETYQTNRQTYSHSQSQTYSQTYQGGHVAPSSPKIYTSYVAFTPIRRPEDSYSQTQTHGTDNTYTGYDEQASIRPAYRPVPTTVDQKPIRYGTYYPSSATTYQGTSQNQDSQRLEQLEYGYSPTGTHGTSGTRPTTYTGTYQPSSSGASYPTGTVYYPSGSTYHPSGSGTYQPSGGGVSNYQNNYHQSQQNRESSYQSVAGQRESGIEYIPNNSPRPTQQDFQTELVDIKDEVRNDISRQINTAIERQRGTTTGTSYSSTSVSSNQVLAELSEELKRNLTRKIEEALREHQSRTGVRGGYTVTVNTGGRINPGSYSREQLATLTTQLQEDLLRQLKEGLAQESYRQTGTSHSAHGGYGGYSSYSSGSSYRRYSSTGGAQAECCIQGDDSTTIPQENVDHQTEDQSKKEPTRGDVSSDDEDSQKVEDDKLPVAIEVIPPEPLETTTRKLARDKPSNKPATVKPVRLVLNKPEQTVEPFDADQQHTEDLTQQSYLDQNNFDQLTDLDQQNQDTLGEDFDQQSSGITQQTVNQFDQQLTEDIQQKYEDQEQTAGRIVQQTQDLSQNRHRQYVSPVSDRRVPESSSHLTQQTQDLAQQLEDLTQQTQDLSQQTHFYGQQNQFLSQERNIPEKYSEQNLRAASQNNGRTINQISQQHDLSQQTEDLTQQTENLAQQTEDLTQQTEDLTQHTEDLSQQAHSSSQLTQQTEDLSQHTQRLSQNSGDVTQQTADLMKQLADLSQQGETQQVENLEPNRSFLYSPPRYQSQAAYALHAQQQTEDDSQNARAQYQQNRGSYGGYSSQSSHSSASYSAASSSASSQVHYASIGELPLQKASDLEQQHIEQQHANIVQDVSQQARQPNQQTVEQMFEPVENVSTTTTKPGFWKKLGKDISKTYSKAKTSILSIG